MKAFEALDSRALGSSRRSDYMTENRRYQFFGNATEHRPLRDLLPLATPLSIHIDPTNVCNLRCQFCPTVHPALLADKGRRLSMMSLGRPVSKDYRRPGAVSR